MRYRQIVGDEAFEVAAGQITRWACCDCGLVHDIVFLSRRRGKVIEVAQRRNNRATAARRRRPQRMRSA